LSYDIDKSLTNSLVCSFVKGEKSKPTSEKIFELIREYSFSSHFDFFNHAEQYILTAHKKTSLSLVR
jgi:hypothetical protein